MAAYCRTLDQRARPIYQKKSPLLKVRRIRQAFKRIASNQAGQKPERGQVPSQLFDRVGSGKGFCGLQAVDGVIAGWIGND